MVVATQSPSAGLGRLLLSGSGQRHLSDVDHTSGIGSASGWTPSIKTPDWERAFPDAWLEQTFGLFQLQSDPRLPVSESVNLLREPDAGDPHVRFDEREVETERLSPPRHLSTLPFEFPGKSERGQTRNPSMTSHQPPFAHTVKNLTGTAADFRRIEQGGNPNGTAPSFRVVKSCLVWRSNELRRIRRACSPSQT